MSIPADKSNVAWFKLAECISRGEKERALSVYRLLSHSLDDRAVASQLEGDIFRAFGDVAMAKNRYDGAIAGYRQDKRLREMATVAQLMHELYPQDRSYLELLIDIYAEIDVKPNVARYCCALVSLLGMHGELMLASQLIDRCTSILQIDDVIAIREQLIFALIAGNKVPQQFVLSEVQIVIDLLTSIDQDMQLQCFLASLQEISAELYAQAWEYCAIGE